MPFDKPPPAPFEIVERDGHRFGSNGRTVVALLDADGRMYRRRGVRGLGMSAVGDRILPALNQLAGDVLANLEMPADELRGRLHALLGMIEAQQPRPFEGLMVEVGDVKVYVCADSVLVSRKDMNP